jgi:hypothetical protein
MSTYLLVPAHTDAIGIAIMQERFLCNVASGGQSFDACFIQWSWSPERQMFVTHTRYSETVFRQLYYKQKDHWHAKLVEAGSQTRYGFLMKMVSWDTVGNTN